MPRRGRGPDDKPRAKQTRQAICRAWDKTHPSPPIANVREVLMEKLRIMGEKLEAEERKHNPFN